MFFFCFDLEALEQNSAVMVIELKASTRRSTYLAGESIKVSISIANLLQTAKYFQTPGVQTTRSPNNQVDKHDGQTV